MQDTTEYYACGRCEEDICISEWIAHEQNCPGNRKGDDDTCPDGLEEVPSHRNDLGDWCPRSGERTADGTCPVYCREADEMAGFEAGRDLRGRITGGRQASGSQI